MLLDPFALVTAVVAGLVVGVGMLFRRRRGGGVTISVEPCPEEEKNNPNSNGGHNG